MGPSAATISTLRGGAAGFQRPSPLPQYFTILQKPYKQRSCMLMQRRMKVCRLSARLNAKSSEWGVEPYTYEEGGGKYYLNELDVASFLDPPKELIPLDPASYNPASYIWKKIEDIPEERRHHLLSLLNPRLIQRAWEVAGSRYDDAKLAKKIASTLLSDGNAPGSLELWNCRTSAAPLPIAWFNSSQKAIFCCTDGKTYGRIIGGYNLLGIINFSSPLYFSARHVNEVMATEQPCDLAYEFGDGLLNLPEYPQGFPKPGKTAKHSWPFNDQVVIYVRHLGPGVVVGQAWQEGKALKQVPKKLCGEILMVKDYSALASLEQ